MIVVLVVLGLAATVALGRYLDRASAMRAARTASAPRRPAPAYRLDPREALARMHESGSVEFR